MNRERQIPLAMTAIAASQRGEVQGTRPLWTLGTITRGGCQNAVIAAMTLTGGFSAPVVWVVMLANKPDGGRSGAETESERAAGAAENRALDATVSRAYFICKLASPSMEKGFVALDSLLGFGRMSVTSPFAEDFCDFFAACRILQPARRLRLAQPILNRRPRCSPIE